MGFIILIILVIVLLIYTLFSKRKKRALLVSLGIIVGYILYTNHACGPDSGDVKVMKPMAQAISEYIVKHGIPKSLKDIPDLPYELEECKREQKNFELCIFYKNNKKYKTEMYILGYIAISIYSRQTETGLRYELAKDTLTKHWKISERDKAYSGKISGICNPMRQ